MFMAPGVILTVVFFLSTGITCTTMISEVHEGIWDRALVTGKKLTFHKFRGRFPHFIFAV